MRVIQTDKAVDPVCGMSVDPATAKHRAEHAGASYFFCSAGCKAKFEADPARFLAGAREPMEQPGVAPPPATAAPAGSGWTCPMHPEIVRDGPGSCPICGMALEPRPSPPSEGPNPESSRCGAASGSRRRSRRAVLLLAMGEMLLPGEPIASRIAPRGGSWLELAARDAGLYLGGLAVLRARRPIRAPPQPQHVHPDRSRHRRRLTSTASSRRSRPASAARLPPRRRGRRSTSRPRR